MKDLLDQVKFYIISAWRNRWYVHLIAWPICLGGWLYVYMMPNQYESSAQVFVDTESILKPLLQGLAVPVNLDQQVAVMRQALLTRPILEKVAQSTELDKRAKTEEDLEALYGTLKRKVMVVGRGTEKLYSISYIDVDPEMSRRVVQALLTIFVEHSLGGTRSDSTLAQQFLDEQIAEYDQRLREAEDRLKEFKRQNVGLMSSEGRNYYERLQEARATLDRAQLELNEERKRRDELLKQQEGEEPTFGIVGSPQAMSVAEMSPLDQRIQSMQTRLDEMLLKYTEEHPDVVTLRRSIDQLEVQRDQERRLMASRLGMSSSAGANDLRINPVYQQLKISLSQSETTIAGLTVRVQEYQQRVRQLQDMVNTIPKVEADLAQLDRDYEIHKRNYEALVSRRESAKISDDAARITENVKFKVIDPPRLPMAPVGPNRPLLTTTALLAAIFLGVAFAIFMSQIKPTYLDRRMLARNTQRPILGAVSIAWTPEGLMKYRRNLASFATLSLALVCVYGGYVAYQLIYLQ